MWNVGELSSQVDQRAGEARIGTGRVVEGAIGKRGKTGNSNANIKHCTA